MSKLEESLEENENLTDEFKELLRNSFKDMLNMLGREGFKKWLRLQAISKNIRTLICEWSDSEKLYDKHRAGEYNELTNKISIRNDHKKCLSIAKHESFHLFTRDSCLNRLSCYLNEGVTDYLTYLTKDENNRYGDENNSYGYQENVEMVMFLRNLIGDSIIRTYLEGKKKYFWNDLNDILKEEIRDDDKREEAMYDFFDDLDRRHRFIYDKEEDDVETIEQKAEKINNFLRKIIICKFRQMSKTRMFNQNGVFNEELARKVINEKLKNARFVGGEYHFLSKEEIANSILEEMMDKIILEMKNYCNPKSRTMYICESQKHIRDLIGKENFSLSKIFENIFERDTQMPVEEFSDYITKLASELNISQDELKELCQKYAFKCFEAQTKVQQVYELIANNIPRNVEVFNFLSKEITSTESKFRKIGDSEYVEQKDGKFVYLKVNDDGTIYQEGDLSKVKDIFTVGDTLESVRLVNREDDYRDLGILNEQKFQLIEMVHSMIEQILYKKNVDIEEEVRKMNLIIQDSQFLKKITETALHKRTRLQVKDLINTLTKGELQEVADRLYDEALLDSGIREIEIKEELNNYYKEEIEYRHRIKNENEEER